jgi:hypothetical protein
MANTISSDLILDTLSDQLITTLGNKLAPLGAFSRDFGTDVLHENANVQVPKATGGSSTLTSPTNWEQGNSTLSNVNVNVKSYAQPFQLSSAHLNGGIKLEQLAKINAQTFADSLMDVAMAPLTTASFAAGYTGSQSAFSSDNIAALWASVAKSSSRHLLLDALAMSQLMPTNRDSFRFFESGAYGFDNIYLNTRWDGANANAFGFACGSEAVAVAAGLPEVSEEVASNMIGRSTVTLEGLGLTVAVNHWASMASRTTWASYDIMFGAAMADNTAGNLLVTA